MERAPLIDEYISEEFGA